ncbi:unnamed protein product [Protopolystoma xenopodis]|uniref:Uncharacterized protein n=1 Tax=Protopolystoma xenopodis TaxID=117903 RepID=A0A3S5ATJ4_9PLAT|nr:unnamed protein product [Protopolystoma xenopodis]
MDVNFLEETVQRYKRFLFVRRCQLEYAARHRHRCAFKCFAQATSSLRHPLPVSLKLDVTEKEEASFPPLEQTFKYCFDLNDMEDILQKEVTSIFDCGPGFEHQALPFDIALAWRAHLLHPGAYARDTSAAFGRILPHPLLSPRGAAVPVHLSPPSCCCCLCGCGCLRTFLAANSSDRKHSPKLGEVNSLLSLARTMSATGTSVLSASVPLVPTAETIWCLFFPGPEDSLVRSGSMGRGSHPRGQMDRLDLAEIYMLATKCTQVQVRI